MNLREAAQQALKALKLSSPKARPEDDDYVEQGWKEHNDAIYSLRVALAEEQNWGEIESLRASLREHIAEVHRLRAAGRQALDTLERAGEQLRWQSIGQAQHDLRAALAEDAMQRFTDEQQMIERGVKAWADVPNATVWVDELRGNQPVTDCHKLEQARAIAVSNLLAHFGIHSTDSDVNVAYINKQLGDFLTAAIGCKKEGDKLSPPLEVEECGYPNCLSTNGCEKQCPAFPRIPDADTGKTSDHFADANKMVATCRDSRLVEPVATINEMETVEPVAWMVYTLDGKSAFITDNPEDFTPEHKSLPLYTAPPKREPLTEEQICEIFISHGRDKETFARAIVRAAAEIGRGMK